MDDVVQVKKSVSSTLLLAVFLLVGLVIIVFSVRTFEAQLAAETAAREAAYAAEYAAIDAAAAAAAEEGATEGTAPAEEAAPAE